MIEILLTQGQVAIIDDCDSDLAELKWCATFDPKSNRFYPIRNLYFENGKHTTERLYRVVLSRTLGRSLGRWDLVDHIDLDTLNNCRENLRLASQSQNKGNGVKHKDNTSGFKGVTWTKRNQKWQAQLMINRKRKHLGYFVNIEDAVEAYRLGAIKYFGEFARSK